MTGESKRRQPTFCTASLQKLCRKTSVWCSRTITGTTNWRQHTVPKLKPKPRSHWSLQEFNTNIQQSDPVGLPETAYTSADGVRDWQVQQHPISGELTLIEALHQALMLEAAQAVAKPSLRLQMAKAEAPTKHNQNLRNELGME
jgi:hypothetical protein